MKRIFRPFVELARRHRWRWRLKCRLGRLAQAVERLPYAPSGISARFLVSSTYLFRDCADYEEILRSDFAERRLPLDILCVGCATGEEAYSVAIICAEHEIPVRVTWTDLSQRAIAAAKAGFYDFSIKNELLKCSDSAEAARRMDRYTDYFDPPCPGNAMRRVKDEIRRRVSFRFMDVCDLPFENAFDFVICRKMLYYLPASKRPTAVSNMLRAFKRGRGWDHIVFDGYTRRQPFFRSLQPE